LVGYNEGHVGNCYAAGRIEGSGETVNALFGQQEGSTDQCYFDNETCGQDDTFGVSRNTSDMTDWENSYPNAYESRTWRDWGNPWLKSSTGYLVLSPNEKIELSNQEVYPSTGYEKQEFQFNVTITDGGDDKTLRDHFREVRLEIRQGESSYDTRTMDYVSGSNTTGAIYTTNITFTSSGLFNYYFSAYDGNERNCTTPTDLRIYSSDTFNINFPPFLELGQYIHSSGSIIFNSTVIDNTTVYTRILNSTYQRVPESYHVCFLVNGKYDYIFSTSMMTPGIYSIIVNFTHLGFNVTTNRTLYLSDYSGPGHYHTTASFSFYTFFSLQTCLR